MASCTYWSIAIAYVFRKLTSLFNTTHALYCCSLYSVWTTHSTGARAKCSIWSPDIGGKKLISRNRVRVVLGHYARPGLSGFGRKVCTHTAIVC
jgi:hypothetical protein